LQAVRAIADAVDGAIVGVGTITRPEDFDLADAAKARLSERAHAVDWLCGDVAAFPYPRHDYDVRRDRAVFHSRTKRKGRAAMYDT